MLSQALKKNTMLSALPNKTLVFKSYIVLVCFYHHTFLGVFHSQILYIPLVVYIIFTESALRPIQSISRDVRMSLCLFVCLSVRHTL